MARIDVFTIFPGLIEHHAEHSLIGRARAAGVVDIRTHDLRAATTDVHHAVDDAPFGGGAGMVLAPGPVFDAVEALQPPRPLLLLGPGGRRFDQATARHLAEVSVTRGFSLLCGRYEGVDERIVEHLVDGVVSIGDYVLAGGEVAAMVVIEAVVRLVPGVVGNASSIDHDSFSGGDAGGLLEEPQFTRPAEFRGWAVPEVLRSGDHGRIASWRRAASLDHTLRKRPDLIAARGGLSDAEVRLLADHGYPCPSTGALDEESDAP